MEFPKRIYTEEEVKRAKALIDSGYKHQIAVLGSQTFKQKTQKALELIKTAEFHDFLRTYIRKIEEIDGLTQLHNSDASIWANKYAVENSVDAASIFIQKAYIMKEYLELKHYYSGEAEKRSVEKRKEFLEKLRNKSKEREVTTECDRLLKLWRESSLVY